MAQKNSLDDQAYVEKMLHTELLFRGGFGDMGKERRRTIGLSPLLVDQCLGLSL